MSIEVSPPSTEPQKTSAASNAAAGKGRDKAGAHDAASGFDAILGALDADSSASPAASSTALTGTAASRKDAPADSMPLDAAAMLAQNPQIPQIPQVPPPLAANAGLPTAKADGDLLASTTSMAAGAKGKSVLALRAGKPGALQAAAGDSSSAGTGTGALNGAASAAGQSGNAASGAAADPSANGASSVADASASSAVSDAKDSKDSKLALALDFMKSVQATPSAELPLPTSGLSRPERSNGERISAASQNTDANTYALTAQGVSSSPTDNATAPGAATPAPEVQVAEQVKYWMSNDVQNAELKLDGLGKDPVQVSISMTGNEAHIAFRTDEAQARGVLEGAAAQLKDMLGREGVVLAGVSVGNSGSQSDSSAGTGDRRPRQGVRQAFVAAPIGSVASTGSRAAVSSGRALDLFV